MKKKLMYIPLALAWIGLPAMGAHILFGQSPVAHQIRPTGKHAQFASIGEGAIGKARQQAVLAATKRYVAAHPEAPAEMRTGRALAPVDALNADLAMHKAKFRVRAVSGVKAQFYEVS